MEIVLTGSLGHIGQPLTEKLTQRGHQLTVITSTPERAGAITDLGATPAIGEVQDAAFLSRTFAGADLVYCIIPPDYTVPDINAYYRNIGQQYAAAIRQAGVPRVVLLSSFGAELDAGTGVILGSHFVEEELKSLDGVQLTIVRPTYFYYNLLNLIGSIRATGHIMTNYGGDDLLYLVAPSDIAEAVVEEIERPAEPRRVRYVYSDERTGNEIATVLGRAIGKPDLQWRVIPDGAVRQAMVDHGMHARMADDLTALNRSLRDGRLAADFLRHKPERAGRVKLEDYAPTFAAAYAGKK
ncbi:NAD(P)H-binding protein [Lewinella sp. IMCC34183]|uniref:NmrA family NAD(P)-binding protein n=1 Tax=Lewinella sp. IMCC34183 TaxID=2248762 RepID=UPI000E233224|nr:NAD(P)H-binding protein [Lewinella sp. IMCC34183]